MTGEMLLFVSQRQGPQAEHVRSLPQKNCGPSCSRTTREVIDAPVREVRTGSRHREDLRGCDQRRLNLAAAKNNCRQRTKALDARQGWMPYQPFVIQHLVQIAGIGPADSEAVKEQKPRIAARLLRARCLLKTKEFHSYESKLKPLHNARWTSLAG